MKQKTAEPPISSRAGPLSTQAGAVVVGSPTGAKNVDAAITLPAYLEGTPDSIRREFVDIYLRNRGHRYNHKATIHFREERSTKYLDALVALIADVSGERVTRSDRNVIVSADAARALEA